MMPPILSAPSRNVPDQYLSNEALPRNEDQLKSSYSIPGAARPRCLATRTVKYLAASGLWHPEPATLLKVRNAMVSRPNEWRKVRKLLNWDDASKLSRPPRGFPCDHEFVDDLKLRDLGSAVEFTVEQACSPKFMGTFAAACRKMSPLAEFLSGALGLPF